MAPVFPLVSIITINYTSLKDTIEFLETATKLTYPNIEIIVVDNNSPYGKPTEDLKIKYSQVTFIESDKNLGFAGGNNVGIRQAKGDFYFLLNNDTLLFPDFLEPIVQFMESHPEVGMASPKVLYPDGKTIQYAGAIGISSFTGRGKCLGIYEPDTGQFDQNYETDLGHGAALIIPRRVVKQIGLMPEVYFLYYEEHDWCEMMKRVGYKMYFLGTSKVIHKESMTTGSESHLKTYYMTRNRLIFMRRNFSGISYLLGMIFFFIVALPKNTFTFLLRGKQNLLKSFYKGIWWNVVNFKIN